MCSAFFGLWKCAVDRGSVLFMHSEEQSVCLWEDSRKVVFTYAIPDIVEQMCSCVRKTKDKTTGRFDTVHTMQPLIGQFYNGIMGGVDLFDNFVYQSRRPIKAYRWYLAVGLQVVYWCVANAFVVKRSYMTEQEKKRYNSNHIRHEIADFLVNLYKPDIPSAIQDMHLIQKVDEKRVCRSKKTNPEPHKCQTICESCKIHLCVGCFFNHHTK